MRRVRLFRFGIAVVIYHAGASVLAWAMGWPPQFGGDPDPDQPYLSYLFSGSAISAPLPPLIALLVGVLLARRRDPWAKLGLVVVAIVSTLFIIGVLGEFFADHPHVPSAAVFLSGAVALLLAITLLALTVRRWREPTTEVT